MARDYFTKISLTGGTSTSTDGVNGDDLIDGDICFTYISEKEYEYKVDDDLAGTEKSPYILNPDTNPGNKSWVLQSRVQNGVNTGHGIYDFDVDGGSQGTFALGSIPDNSSIKSSWYEVITPPTSGGAASIALGVATNDVIGVTGASSYSGGGFKDAGYHDTPLAGVGANPPRVALWTTKTTAERDVILTISIADLTAGVIHVWWEYVISE